MKDALASLCIFLIIGVYFSSSLKQEIAIKLHETSHQLFGDLEHDHLHEKLAQSNHGHVFIDGFMTLLDSNQKDAPETKATLHFTKSLATITSNPILQNKKEYIVDLKSLPDVYWHYSFQYHFVEESPPEVS